MSKDTRYLPALAVRWEENCGGGGYVHLIARPCLIDTTKHQPPGYAIDPTPDTPYGQLEWPAFGFEEYGWMKDLRVHSQGNNSDQPRKLYGWDLEYRPFEVKLSDARIMCKTLERLTKAIEKIEQEWGYTNDLPEFVLRVAKAMKVKYVLFENNYERKERSGYRYQVREPGKEAKYTLEDMVRTWVEAGQPADASA
jgi:hypothetical protein